MYFKKKYSVVLLAALTFAACSCSVHSLDKPKPRVLAQQASSPTDHSISFDDSAQDGTPDFLRLDTEQDRAAFRRWFTFLAEVQYFTPAGQRPNEITDCSSLVRYSYREALRRHDTQWATEAHLFLTPAFGSVEKYSYPRTPLGPALFRVRNGTFAASDLHNGSFAQFADAETLERYNTFRLSGNIYDAQPGDLLFFGRAAGGGRNTFHSMIFLGRSQIQPSTSSFVIYDTGPDGARSGEIRRLSIADLLRFPEPEWRPYPANPQFLGIFRWNILHGE